MNRLDLTMAMGDYEHVRDLADGRIRPEGVDLRALHLPVEQIFARFAACREWDVSEFSFAKYVSLVAAGDRSLVALPVFPSRVFRHSSIYVREDSPLTTLEELAGRRIGVPEWAQTASVYTRGILHHHHGVELTGVRWFQAGVNEPGRQEKVQIHLPDGVSLERVADRSLSQLLLDGDLDAVLSARPPEAFTRGAGTIRRLLRDPIAAERSYMRRTSVFPIMHVVVLRADVHERHPWVARNLFDAFQDAKAASLTRLADVTSSRLPLPWLDARVADAVDLIGDDPWPYGIERNRPTLEAFLCYAYEQGVAARKLAPEELFAASTSTHVRV